MPPGPVTLQAGEAGPVSGSGGASIGRWRARAWAVPAARPAGYKERETRRRLLSVNLD